VTGTAPPDLDNVLLTDWTGPFGGVPAFDRMELDALKPALESGMASQLAEIDAIASNPEPPTFENTIVALERSGRALSRVFCLLRGLEIQRVDPRIPRGAGGHGAAAGRIRIDDHTELGAVRSHPGRV
jgi:Zn-dependent oligopeptidase